MDIAKLKQRRLRARTDLYWLAKDILGLTELNERVHRPVCEHFWQMKPGTPIAELSPQKGMSLFDPRGHFKTSIAQASAIQWILNYPNIRLFWGSGKLDQASDSLVVIKTHFQTNDKLRALFPEFCPPKGADWGTKTEFTIPNRTKVLTDPTCKAFSLDSIKAGPHCDVLFLDDAVHPGNVGNVEMLQKTVIDYSYLTPIIEPYGYRHVIGTPYSDADLYAWLEENDPLMRKFRRAAWSITNPDYVEGTPLKESDVELLFPERFTFSGLNVLREQDQYVFNCQYLMDPTPRDTASFTDALITSHTLPAQHVPKHGALFQMWDTANTKEKYSDYSVGATGLYDNKGNLFIVDIVVGKFTPTELVNQIVSAALKWKPQRVGIEEAAGARMLEPALDMMQRQMRQRFNIEWIKTSPLKSKAERVLSLQPLLAQHKLYFSGAIRPDFMAELKKQFLKFPRYVHDDIPDAISRLLIFRGGVDIRPDVDDEDASEVYSVAFDPHEDTLLGAGLVG
jgi:predicted phage terminase large subunit-like protein